MAYNEQKILSAIPGGDLLTELTRESVDSDDIGQSATVYLGAHPRSDENSLRTADDQVYFDKDNEIFRIKAASINAQWVTHVPTSNNVFGTSKTSSDPLISPRTVVWLGKNNGATGSEKVNTYSELRNYFNSNSYDSTNIYYYYNSGTEIVEEVLQHFTPNGIEIVKENLDKSYINRAVTLVDDFTIHDPKVQLARDDDIVIGSILSYNYRRLQIAVEGWDVKFINGTNNLLTIGSKIIGKSVDNVNGYIQPIPDFSVSISGNEEKRSNGRGYVVDTGYKKAGNIVASVNIVKVSMIFGAW